MIERPCNCAQCAAWRLARAIFLAFLAVLALIGFLHRHDGRGRVLIDPPPTVASQADIPRRPLPICLAPLFHDCINGRCRPRSIT